MGERIFSDYDAMSMYIYCGLCRTACLEPGEASWEEARLRHALQNICAWSLALLCQLGPLSSGVLWAWASGDALWVYAAINGILSFHPGRLQQIGLLAPKDLHNLKESVVAASFGLTSPAIAFQDVVEENLPVNSTYGDFTVALRCVCLAQHRAQIAMAVVDCNFFDALLQDAAACRRAPWLPSMVSFLAALTHDPIDHPTAWTQVVAEKGVSRYAETLCFNDAQKAMRMLIAQVSAQGRALWELLLVVPRDSPQNGGGTRFILDCAAFAHRVPMISSEYCSFLENCFEGRESSQWSPRLLAALCTLAANC